MGKFFKGLCGIAGITFMAGLALLIVGFSMGGRPVGIQLRWDNGPKLVQTTLPRWSNAETASATLGTGRNSSVLSNTDGIRNLDFEIGAAKVTIQSGTDFSLEVLGDAKYYEEQNGDTWVIETQSPSFGLGYGDNVEFIITVPKGVVFDFVSFQIGAGQLSASDISCKNAVLNTGAGTMKLTSFFASQSSSIEVGMGTIQVNGDLRGAVDIECGMGKADFLLQRPTSFGYQIDCALGNVEVDSDSFSGAAVEKSYNTNADTLYSIDCGMGSTSISFTT